MAAVSTYILRSMRLTGEKARGATLDSNEQTECLAEFNTFLESLSLERLACYTFTQDSKALTASTESYTIGANGAFAVTRPNKIVDPCFIRDASGYDTPLELIDAEMYGRLVDKDAGYTVPTYLFYDMGYSATSTGTLYLYPSPSDSLTLYINSLKPIGPVVSLTTNILVPPGYQLMLETNFAVHLAAGLTPVSPELARMARESKAAIKSLNQPDVVMHLDSGAVGYGRRSNIFTGS